MPPNKARQKRARRTAFELAEEGLTGYRIVQEHGLTVAIPVYEVDQKTSDKAPQAPRSLDIVSFIPSGKTTESVLVQGRIVGQVIHQQASGSFDLLVGGVRRNFRTRERLSNWLQGYARSKLSSGRQ